MSSTKIQKQDLDMDSLASAIQSLMNSGVIKVGAVKSVQRGVITFASTKTTATATISAVDTSKSVVLFTGNIGEDGSSGYSYHYDCMLQLTNSTTVTATRGFASNIKARISYQVIEYA